VGEAYSLLTGFLWAVGVILFKKAGTRIGAFALNLFKNTLATALFALTLLATRQSLWPSLEPTDFWLLFLSGVLGIGISDLLFLQCLHLIGASRAALVDCLYSPAVILFSYLSFGERLTPLAAMGGLLIIGSVLLSSERSFGAPVSRRNFAAGAFLGTASMLVMGVAIVMMKPYLKTVSLPWICMFRMGAGALAALALTAFHPKRAEVFRVFRPQRAWRTLIPASLVASYFSLAAWVAGFKYTETNTAALLNQLSTVFIVALAIPFLREPLTRLKAVAVGVALIGGTLVML
jgi:drug/metabolite transporter (DMT)-like permease